jgi:hypothetical protein
VSSLCGPKAREKFSLTTNLNKPTRLTMQRRPHGGAYLEQGGI